MVPLLTGAQMSALDRLTIEELGLPAAVLMEVAGRAVADAAEAAYRDAGRPVFALAGTGNNGADAVVAARHLHGRGVPVTAFILGEEGRLTEDAARQRRIAERFGVAVEIGSGDAGAALARARAEGCGVLIDGLFGTGLARPLAAPHLGLVEALGTRDDLTVVAVDIPSGVHADTGQVLGAAVPADVTVTFQLPKRGHVLYPGRALAGVLTIADIGIPVGRVGDVAPTTHIVSVGRIRDAFSSRAADSHKGTYGHLLVVAGAPDRPGAGLLTSRAALRSGAGLVTFASDEETVRRSAPALEAVMGLSVGLHRPDAGAVRSALEGRSALAIGPSLAPDPRTVDLLKGVVLASDRPAVVDAGALSALAGDIEWLKSAPGPLILTPHPGEMARMTGLDVPAIQRDRVGTAVDVAVRTGAHVVLKGASTVVAHPDGTAGVVVAGNAGMATAGSGDVLTGVLGALLARGVAAETAAEAGVLLHALAGDRAAESLGETGLTAPDLLPALASVVRDELEGSDA